MEMTPDNWQRVKILFEAALEKPAEQRTQYLAEAAVATGLRDEVERLLGNIEDAGSFLERPAFGDPTPSTREIESSFLSAGRVLAGRFKLIRFLARGGMGEVYEAEDQEFQDRVAVKLVRPDLLSDPRALQRFRREVHLAKKVTHPNVCRTFDLFRHSESEVYSGELVFVSMELLQGQTLTEFMKDRGRFSPSEALPIITQIAGGLDAAHNVGVVHRDFKPGNVIMVRNADGSFRAVITDFGLALRSAGDLTTRSIAATTSHGIMGTPAYMAPEQIEGREVTSSADIYAFGLVMHEMVCGVLPFASETPFAAIVRRVQAPPPSPRSVVPNLDPAWESVILRCLERDPANRFATASEAIRALRSTALERPATDAEPISEVEPKSKRKLPSLQRLLAASVALVTAVSIVSWLIVRSNSTSKSPIPPLETMKLTRLTNDGKSVIAAISGDGKYVAHVVRDADKQSLWVRQVRTASDVQIISPSTFSFDDLVFSRDGSYVYFVAHQSEEGRLFFGGSAAVYRVPFLGGTPQRLVDHLFSTIDFSPDGNRFVFVGGGGLMLSNLDGTGERRIGGCDACGNWYPLPSPAWSPDGKRVAVFFADGGFNTVSISEALGAQLENSARSREHIALSGELIHMGRPAWLLDGTALVMAAEQKDSPYSSQLWLISYPSGRASRITNDLNYYEGVSLTADSSTLATAQRQMSSSISIATPRVSAARQVSSVVGRYAGTNIAWTADDKLLFESTERNADIWEMNADGSDIRQLTADAGNNSSPCVSPDGRTVFFISDRAGHENVWKMDIDGSNLTEVSRGGGAGPPSVTEDGKWVLYSDSSTSDRGGKSVWRVPASGGNPIELPGSAKWDCGRAEISPNGEMIACPYLDFGNSKFRARILTAGEGRFLRDLDIRLITDFRDVLFQGPRDVRWSPDSQGLDFIDTRNGVSGIWSQPINGGRSSEVMSFTSDKILSYVWSPDGKQLAIARASETSDIILIHNFR